MGFFVLFFSVSDVRLVLTILLFTVMRYKKKKIYIYMLFTDFSKHVCMIACTQTSLTAVVPCQT